MQQYCEVAQKQLRSRKAQKASRHNLGPDIFSHGDNSTVEGTVYKQAEQLFGLRHKPLTLQDALPRSESAEKICPGRTRCLLSRHPLCHPVQADYRSP
ncbi:hypothetical protein GQ457_16G017330 [Hibiscus cannabinus]